MSLSNDAEAVARFWRNYRIALRKAGVTARAEDWYVRHAEAYVNASGGRRLATHEASDVEAWLGERGRVDGMTAWQFAQAVDAVRCLLVLARSAAVDAVDWRYWREGARPLLPSHPTIARVALRASAEPSEPDRGPADDSVERLIAVVRQRNYSIRTEQAYRGWVERFRRFIRADPQIAGASEVKAFLQSLAVEGRVAASTQNQALNALVFFYDKVLERPLGDLGGFARAKQARRLPVVLSRGEVSRLLKHLHGVHWLMAALLYGTGMRLMECVRLRVKDVEFEHRQILVRDGKGQKNRVVPLPTKLVDALGGHLEKVRALHEADLARGRARRFFPARWSASIQMPLGVGAGRDQPLGPGRVSGAGRWPSWPGS